MRRRRAASVVGVAAVLAVTATGCGGHAPSMLGGEGTESSRVANVWWLMFGLATAVYVVVAAFIVVAILRGRRRGAVEGTGPKDDTFIWLGGIVAPVVILTILAVVTVSTTSALRKPARGELRIDVIGKRWWWDVRYPDSGVVTANEIHIPIGRQIDFQLRSDNVLHSFWVPQLAGKVDTVPGQTNHLRLKATSAGTYRGECAEYCGLEHAHMNFLVIAENPVDFDRWLARRGGDAGSRPTDELSARGQLVFEREACAGCHTVRGTQATGTLGPDLSDFGSRRWIGSLTVPNTPSKLAAWIINPGSFKPGTLMPPASLSPDDINALTAYLEGLK